ncbi:hypothetical protein [Streptosporangium sp. V21-05]|uniref:hypothetical protein n=1 Tax=Streptosporangium sp. V21-05 TaxID=3446115 RepID=UPI003F531862
MSGRDEVQVVSGQAGVRASGFEQARVNGSYVRVNGSYEVRTSGPDRVGARCFERIGEVRAGGRRGIRPGEGSGGHEGRRSHGDHGDHEDRSRAARAVGEGL